MKNFIVTKPLIDQINEMRYAIEDNIINLLEQHNVKSVDCYEFDDCPVIIDVTYEDDFATLDSINLETSGTGKKYISFDCSSSFSNYDMALINMDIERLIFVYEWIKENRLNFSWE